ncbi:fungal-specific transcription factor domain-containing protein [Aspergillus spectabilis]
MQPATSRSSTACYRCYKRKVKCSREKPCQNCRLASKDCQYPTRDRNVTVSENYLRTLQARAAHSADVAPFGHSPLGPPAPLPGEGTLGCTAENPPPEVAVAQNQLSDPLVEDPTPEVFVSGLKQLHSPTSLVAEGPPAPRQAYEFYQLDYDNSDRMRLCRLLVVFALGESYNSEPVPEIRLPPGTEFFEQALALLKIHHEDPSMDQVEALNLVAFYSYSLNRKKAAYMYAGLSIRMSNVLKLHKPSSPPLPALEVEHRKRVWWTTCCIDRMTSTEMGLPPAFQVHQVEQSYPDDAMLLPADRDEFHDAETLTTQVQLAFIHGDICENVRSIRKDNTTNVGDLTRPILHRLEEVRARLPRHVSFDVENGMSPAMKQMADRSLASLYQRYHQCFVLLLRPLFLKQISYLLAGDIAKAYQDDLKFLTNTSHFGFWESLHLSSGLMILSLAMSVNSRWPNSFDDRDHDRDTYDTAKSLLRKMIGAGNLGSKGHGLMLAEVEAFQNGLFGASAQGQQVFDLGGWDVDEWIEQAIGIVKGDFWVE